MCCDWLDLMLVSFCSFLLGAIVTGWLAKYLIQEEQRESMNIHKRTELKDRKCV